MTDADLIARVRALQVIHDDLEGLPRKECAELVESSSKLAERLAETRAENACDVCGGTGTPVSNKPCMCRGTGRMSEAARFLREQLFDAETQLAETRAKVEQMREERDKWRDRFERRFKADFTGNGSLDERVEQMRQWLEDARATLALEITCAKFAALFPAPAHADTERT